MEKPFSTSHENCHNYSISYIVFHLLHLQAKCRSGTEDETLKPGAEKESVNLSIRSEDLRHQQRIPVSLQHAALSEPNYRVRGTQRIRVVKSVICSEIAVVGCENDQRL